jgi:hypothetical protein
VLNFPWVPWFCWLVVEIVLVAWGRNMRVCCLYAQSCQACLANSLTLVPVCACTAMHWFWRQGLSPIPALFLVCSSPQNTLAKGFVMPFQ